MTVNSKVTVFRDADSLPNFTGTCCILLYLLTYLHTQWSKSFLRS